MKVSDVMSRDFITVSPDDNAVEVGNLLDKRSISGAVVMQGDGILGLVSKETFIAHIHKVQEKPLEFFHVCDFMESDITPLKADDDLLEAIDLIQMLPMQLDRLPVVSDGKLVGILSKVELTSMYAKDMKGHFKVKDIMEYNPTTVEAHHPLSEVVEEMKNSGIKSVLVMEGVNLVGLISVKDISLCLFREKKACKRVDSVSLLAAGDVMTRTPITTKGREDSAKAAAVMIEKEVGSLPVVGKGLEGILTRTDLLKAYQLLRQQSKS